MPTGNVANGAKLFKLKCAQCHTCLKGEGNKQGPSLFGIVGRKSGSIPGFAYSDANAKSGVTWDIPTLFKYLENPAKFIPGTKMVFAGLKLPQERADMIAFLGSNK